MIQLNNATQNVWRVDWKGIDQHVQCLRTSYRRTLIGEGRRGVQPRFFCILWQGVKPILGNLYGPGDYKFARTRLSRMDDEMGEDMDLYDKFNGDIEWEWAFLNATMNSH